MIGRGRTYGVYRKYMKRPLDVILALGTLILISPALGIIAIMVRINLGSPVIFRQQRPGIIDPITGKEKIFYLYKFRTMTNKRDSSGALLPDKDRLTKFGEILRKTSLDELPELINIIKGDMSIIGPRPQLVRDMVFMTKEQRKRHIVRPGLSGLSQVRGRNAISWESKLSIDLEYIEKITFWIDLKIIFQTFLKILACEGVTEKGMVTATDYGDYLLASGKIDRDTYWKKQQEAKEILR